MTTNQKIIIASIAAIATFFCLFGISNEGGVTKTNKETDSGYPAILSRLEKEMQLAVEEENYEEAAKLRDEIAFVKQMMQSNKKTV